MTALTILLDAEIDRTIGSAIRQAIRQQSFNQCDDRTDVLGGMRRVVWPSAAQRIEILEELCFILASVLAQGLACFADPLDDLVLHVRDIHDKGHLVISKFEITPHQISEDERAKIPDVREVMDRRAAAIHTDLLAFGIKRNKFLHRPRARVEQFQTHVAETRASLMATSPKESVF